MIHITRNWYDYHYNWKKIKKLWDQIETTCLSAKDSKASKDENCVDNFAAKLTNRDLCLYDLNVTLRIPLFNMIPLGILFSYCASFTKSYNVIVCMNTKFCIIQIYVSDFELHIYIYISHPIKNIKYFASLPRCTLQLLQE